MAFDYQDHEQCFLGHPFVSVEGELDLTDLWPGGSANPKGLTSVSVLKPGELKDINFASHEILVLKAAVHCTISELIEGDVLSFDAVSDEFSEPLKIVHFPRTLECLDELHSHFEKAHDRRGNRKYRSVSKIVVRLTDVPDGAHIFRIADWPAPVICSGTVKDILESYGATGVRFESVRTSHE